MSDTISNFLPATLSAHGMELTEIYMYIYNELCNAAFFDRYNNADVTFRLDSSASAVNNINKLVNFSHIRNTFKPTGFFSCNKYE